MSKLHYSVMLNECLSALKVESNKIYVDLTLGMGGHSKAILKELDSNGKLIAFDKDAYAISQADLNLKELNKPNYILVQSDFKNLKQELFKLGISKVDGILADLGVSSPQLDQAERGFSYNKDAKLDMRMNQEQQLSAWDVVNSYFESDLANILWNYADVKLAKQVAKAIIKSRPINTTLELVEVIKSAYPAALLRKKNPAKAVFQAIRIEVNNELNSLKELLTDAIDLLNPNGNLAIITFHSLEDKIVKEFIKEITKSSIPNKMPIQETKKFLVKQLKPSQKELDENKRSRSAKLRVITKLY